ITAILRSVALENRGVLTEFESKKVLEFYNFPVVKTYVAKDEDEAVAVASRIGYPVVLKVLSPQIVHKTDAGGVILDVKSEDEVREAFKTIIKNAKRYNPKAEIIGVTVQPMVKKRGVEVILGSKKDVVFGPVIMFGMGGVGVELFRDYSIGLPPLNQTLARRMMEETKVYQLLKGFRGMPPANVKRLEEVMVLFSHLLMDFPQIKEVDINPLLVDEKDVIGIDARIIIDKELILRKLEPHQHLVISPYPKKYEALWRMRDGRTVLLRPIKPEDEPLWLEMLQNCSEETIHYKLFQTLKHMPHEVRVRYCNIDYDREIAIVAELTENGTRKIIGTARVSIELDGKTGEIAFLVADPWQGLGLGTKLVDYVIEICRERGLESVYGIMLPENQKAIELMRNLGFQLKYMEDGTIMGTLNLKEEEPPTKPIETAKLMEIALGVEKAPDKETKEAATS
ncbi:MAG: GNAT family N-acetyltransferase, partial [Candidatus Bathyarchaeia archaeon]